MSSISYPKADLMTRMDQARVNFSGSSHLRLAGDKVNVIEGKKYWVLRKNRMILLCVLL